MHAIGFVLALYAGDPEKWTTLPSCCFETLDDPNCPMHATAKSEGTVLPPGIFPYQISIHNV